MTTKKSTYVDIELEWLEQKFEQFRKAVDNYDLTDLKDRMDIKNTKNGGTIHTVIASKEDQLKAIMFIMEKLPKLLQSIDELREKVSKTALRGDEELPEMMQ